MEQWDDDRNGLISKKEWRKACAAMGILFPREVVDSLFDFFDEDGSGSLDHKEVVLKARRAAFQRGFVPKQDAKPPNALRRLDAYWARRNRTTMERHEQQVEMRQQAEQDMRQRRVDDRCARGRTLPPPVSRAVRARARICHCGP